MQPVLKKSFSNLHNDETLSASVCVNIIFIQPSLKAEVPSVHFTAFHSITAPHWLLKSSWKFTDSSHY